VALAFYDAEADTLLLSFAEAADVTIACQGWGAVVREWGTGRAVSAEIWSASKLFPRVLLDAVPRPTDTTVRPTRDLGYFDRDTDSLWFRLGPTTGVEIRAVTQALPSDLLDLFPPRNP
jgi:hypothetical protein